MFLSRSFLTSSFLPPSSLPSSLLSRSPKPHRASLAWALCAACLPGTALAAPPPSCQVVVVGVSLGGVMAAHQASLDGATTCLISNNERYGGQLTEQATPIDLQYGGMSLTYEALEYFAMRYYGKDPMDPTQRPFELLAGKLSDRGQTELGKWSTDHLTQDWTTMPAIYQPGKSRRLISFEPKAAAYAITHNLLTETPKLTLLRYYTLKDVNGTWTDCSHFTVESLQIADSANVSYTLGAGVTIDATELGDLYALIAKKAKPLSCNGGFPSQDSIFYVGRDGAARFTNYLGDGLAELSEADSGGRAPPDSECVQPITFPIAIERVRPGDGSGQDPILGDPYGYAGIIEQKVPSKEINACSINPPAWNATPGASFACGTLCTVPAVTPAPISCDVRNDTCGSLPGNTGSSCSDQGVCEFKYTTYDGTKTVLHSPTCTPAVRRWQQAAQNWAASTWAYRRVAGHDDPTQNDSTFVPVDAALYQWGPEFGIDGGSPSGDKTYSHDVTILNLRANDLLPGNQVKGVPDPSKEDKICPKVNNVQTCNIIGKSGNDLETVLAAGRNVSLSVYNWWRHGQGGASLKTNVRLRPDVFGWPYPYDQTSAHAVTAFPYIREARRLNASHIITQNEAIGVSAANTRGIPYPAPGVDRPPTTNFADSVGLASYVFDTHGCTTHAVTGEVVMAGDAVTARRMQIPLGALVPLHVNRLLSGNSKTMGVTHITNMAFRTHLAEANAGQAAGAAAAVAAINLVPLRDMANRWDPALKRWVPGSQNAWLRQVQCHLVRATRSNDAAPSTYLGGSGLSWNGSVPRFASGAPNRAWVREQMALVGESTDCGL
ncbi:MAG: FAD-dependent oxidoreductase [Pseudomonadota bacterium]